jgi:hypothetical protein
VIVHPGRSLRTLLAIPIGTLAIALAMLHAFASDHRYPAGPWGVSFTDVAEAAGLRTDIVYGGIDRKRFIIETNGSGVALIDYDNDGWLDALTLSGARLKEGTREEVSYPLSAAPTNRLYRNRRNGTFEDVTEAAGLRRSGWASSVCAGDYDNDGWVDLFLTYYGRNVLYRNRGEVEPQVVGNEEI